MMLTARLDSSLFFFFTLSSPFISPRLYQLHFCLSIKLACCVICSDLQFQAEEHSEEDKTETEEADGQADQPSEQSSLPGWVVELLTACHGTAALHSLQRQQRKKKQSGRAVETVYCLMISIILTGKWMITNLCARCAP